MTYESGRLTIKPTQVKWAVAGLWFQTAVNLLSVMYFYAVAQDRFDHGQSGGGLLRLLAVGSLLIVVLLAVSARMASRGAAPWAWWLAIVLEGIVAINSLVVIFSGKVLAIIGLLIAVGIAGSLLSIDSRQWFALPANRRT